MLEQYHKDRSSDSDDALSESQFQMSQRKLVFILATGAFALLLFLFLIGGFKEEEEASPIPSTPETAAIMNANMIHTKLQDLEIRLGKLETQNAIVATEPKQIASLAEIAFTPQTFEEESLSDQNSMIVSTESLHQLVASNPTQSEPVTEPQIAATLPKPEPTIATKKLKLPQSYIVQPGDSLSKISSKFYGTTKHWKEIYSANRERISNMNQLKVGTKLIIPEEVK